LFTVYYDMISQSHLPIPDGLIEEILILRQQNKGVRNS